MRTSTVYTSRGVNLCSAFGEEGNQIHLDTAVGACARPWRTAEATPDVGERRGRRLLTWGPEITPENVFWKLCAPLSPPKGLVFVQGLQTILWAGKTRNTGKILMGTFPTVYPVATILGYISPSSRGSTTPLDPREDDTQLGSCGVGGHQSVSN